MRVIYKLFKSPEGNAQQDVHVSADPGLDTRGATEALQHELGKKPKLMAIGPGGENGVRYACILTGTRHAAGRTGMGAVMGAKNLKGIAVRGVFPQCGPRWSAAS